MNPSPIASPIPSSRPAATPLQSALAAQIGALTHLVDGMERFQSVAVPRSTVDYLEGIIEKIHSTIDGLNALYESSLNDTSENRRAKWLLRDILRDLPTNKDWLDPDTERAARALVGSQVEVPVNRSCAATERAEALRAVLLRLVHSPDLSLENMEPETYAAIYDAKQLLYPN